MIYLRASGILFFFAAIFCCFDDVHFADVNLPEDSDSLLCRRCGHSIVQAKNLKSLASKLALRQRNDTILGTEQCLIQLFKNPNGNTFEVITADSAGIQAISESASEDHSWFPGFAWRIAVCSQCGTHLGWTFEIPDKEHVHHDHTWEGEDRKTSTTEYSFIGLIFNKLIEEHYADSLLHSPKAYTS